MVRVGSITSVWRCPRSLPLSPITRHEGCGLLGLFPRLPIWNGTSPKIAGLYLKLGNRAFVPFEAELFHSSDRVVRLRPNKARRLLGTRYEQGLHLDAKPKMHPYLDYF